MSDSYDIDPKREDAELIEALAQIARRPVPPGFVLATTLRFQRAVRARYWRRFALSAAMAMLVASVMLWLILINLPSFTMDFAFALGKLKAVLSALNTVWSYAPQLGAVVTFSLWMVVLGCMGVLVKLVKSSQAAKLTAPVPRTTQ